MTTPRASNDERYLPEELKLTRQEQFLNLIDDIVKIKDWSGIPFGKIDFLRSYIMENQHNPAALNIRKEGYCAETFLTALTISKYSDPILKRLDEYASGLLPLGLDDLGLTNIAGIVNEPNNRGLTPLILASMNGKCEKIKFLFQFVDFDINAPGGSEICDKTALFYAAISGKLEVLDLLLSIEGIDRRDAQAAITCITNSMQEMMMSRQKHAYDLDLLRCQTTINMLNQDYSSTLMHDAHKKALENWGTQGPQHSRKVALKSINGEVFSVQQDEDRIEKLLSDEKMSSTNQSSRPTPIIVPDSVSFRSATQSRSPSLPSYGSFTSPSGTRSPLEFFKSKSDDLKASTSSLLPLTPNDSPIQQSENSPSTDSSSTQSNSPSSRPVVKR